MGTIRAGATVIAPTSAVRRFSWNGILWTGQSLLGILFAGSGFGKVLFIDDGIYAEAPDAVSWYADVPQNLIVVIGVCEVLGGLGLLLPGLSRIKPRLTVLAAFGLAVTMALATIFHLAREEFLLAVVTLALTAAPAALAVGRLRHPLPAEPLTGRRATFTSIVLIAIAVLVFLPTWYSASNADF